MGFFGFFSIIFILHVLHVCSSFLCTVLWFVLCCVYHIHDKMSLRCFYVSLWIPLSTKFVGIIMFFDFETSNDYVFFTLCPSFHTFAYEAHIHTL